MPETDIVTSEGVAIVSRRKYGVYSWGLAVSLLLVTFTIVVLAVVLLLDNDNTVVLLIVLIITLLLVGVTACFFLQWLHRRAIRRRDEGAKAWITRTISGNQLTAAPEPTPPPEPNAPSLSPRSSWIHWAPWRKSSRSTGPPSYSAVGRNGGSSS